jgi:hypothetical protein
VIAGSLLSEFHLGEGLRETPEWRVPDADQVTRQADAPSALRLALRWVRDGLIAGGMLREVEVTAAMPKARPWQGPPPDRC